MKEKELKSFDLPVADEGIFFQVTTMTTTTRDSNSTSVEMVNQLLRDLADPKADTVQTVKLCYRQVRRSRENVDRTTGDHANLADRVITYVPQLSGQAQRLIIAVVGELGNSSTVSELLTQLQAIQGESFETDETRIAYLNAVQRIAGPQALAAINWAAAATNKLSSRVVDAAKSLRNQLGFGSAVDLTHGVNPEDIMAPDPSPVPAALSHMPILSSPSNNQNFDSPMSPVPTQDVADLHPGSGFNFTSAIAAYFQQFLEPARRAAASIQNSQIHLQSPEILKAINLGSHGNLTHPSNTRAQITINSALAGTVVTVDDDFMLPSSAAKVLFDPNRWTVSVKRSFPDHFGLGFNLELLKISPSPLKDWNRLMETSVAPSMRLPFHLSSRDELVSDFRLAQSYYKTVLGNLGSSAKDLADVKEWGSALIMIVMHKIAQQCIGGLSGPVSFDAQSTRDVGNSFRRLYDRTVHQDPKEDEASLASPVPF